LPVKLTSGGKMVYPLTSPPAKPDPLPIPELIAKTSDYADRSIAVSVPFPDSIELVTDVTNEMLMTPNMQGGSVKAIFGLIDEELKEHVEGLKNGQAFFSPAPKLTGFMGGRHKAIFQLNYQDEEPLHRAFLTLQRRIGPDYPIWSLRLEFSAWKAGPAGLVKLTSLMEEALPLTVSNVIAAFVVSRIDAAIDCIGAEPIDLIAHIPKGGKRLTYVGDNGRPETVYLFEKKKPLAKPPGKLGIKTTGPARLKLYERRAYLSQFHLLPTYGSCPVTRAEVQLRWTKGRPSLAKLLTLSNPYHGVRVAYAPPVGDNTRSWRQFCLAAFGAGSSAAMSAFFPGSGIAAQKLYEACPGDLIDKTCWKRWNEGLTLTGLQSWIDLSAG
jgi:hypothetical protein